MNDLRIKGRIIRQGEKAFDKAVLATSFNRIDPGSRPALLAEPLNVEDIITLLKYAQSRNLKISVCSGGHSWSQNHIREGSLLIDLCHFKQYAIDKENMQATAGPAVGGSVLLMALWKQGLFFPAGHCKGVCIGGYLLQGGFGWNSRRLGMACESVLGLDIVTADGHLVHASETENTDLWWAARGAGAGFFGIVVRFHLRIYPKPKFSGNLMHVFSFEHLEEVLRWAYTQGPKIPETVEFQMLMSRKTVRILGPGIEAVAPIFAETKAELEEARAFMEDSPIKHLASFRTPYLRSGMRLKYNFAMTHYPNKHGWGVDNMWTGASVEELIPFFKGMVATLPPPPAHILWLNWYPPQRRTDMAFSMEDNIYIALYGAWKSPKDTPLYGHWASDWMKKMAHLESGIQLADEGLHKRTSHFVKPVVLQQLQAIRQKRDAEGRFFEWHSMPTF
ncbi:MAG TPA: FAD-binding oxidoreductase [Saprospiraceae bacterium]|nr:FAD-binding oxidoreductase [Saprospiraceae bacterium]HMQ81711.1 FAD-binding oxidoreductase [Saprospiraceae bacterium]